MFFGNKIRVEHRAKARKERRSIDIEARRRRMESPCSCLWWASVCFLRFRFSVLAPTIKPTRKTPLAFSFPLENGDALRDRWQSSLVPTHATRSARKSLLAESVRYCNTFRCYRSPANVAVTSRPLRRQMANPQLWRHALSVDRWPTRWTKKANLWSFRIERRQREWVHRISEIKSKLAVRVKAQMKLILGWIGNTGC